MENMTMNRQLGTKWFTFYTKVRPWLSCLLAFSVIRDFTQYPDVYCRNWWLLLYFLVAVAQPILSIIVAVKSKGDYVGFVRFVKGVLLFETISTAYQQGVVQYLNNGLQIGVATVAFAITLVLAYLLWYRLNVKYFEKRILGTNHYFAGGPDHVAEYKPCGDETVNFSNVGPDCGGNANQYGYYNQEQPNGEQRIYFCRTCGEKLIDGSRFCRKCGTEVTRE